MYGGGTMSEIWCRITWLGSLRLTVPNQMRVPLRSVISMVSGCSGVRPAS
jgi:hypothetical protein